MTDDMHQVNVDTDFAADGIAIWITLKDSMGRRILRPDGRNFIWEQIEPATNVTPTAVLGDAHGRALMDALLRYYNGTPDSNTLRQDLMHERERRDKLEDHLMEVARPRPQVWAGGGLGSVAGSNAPGSASR